MANSWTPERKARITRLTVDLEKWQYAQLEAAAQAATGGSKSRFTRIALKRLIAQVNEGTVSPATVKAAVAERDVQWMAFLAGQGPYPVETD